MPASEWEIYVYILWRSMASIILEPRFDRHGSHFFRGAKTAFLRLQFLILRLSHSRTTDCRGEVIPEVGLV